MRIILLLAAIAANISQVAVNPMNQATLKSYLEKGAPFNFILIDLRGSEEISAAIGNAACKPYNLAWPEQFKNECVKIPKDQAIVVYCQSGGRSRNAAAYLNANGYTQVYDAGGYKTWGGPTIPASDMKPASLLPEPSMRAQAAELRFMKQPLMSRGASMRMKTYSEREAYSFSR
jgi:rhodanese-related sulfurtransferase